MPSCLDSTDLHQSFNFVEYWDSRMTVGSLFAPLLALFCLVLFLQPLKELILPISTALCLLCTNLLDENCKEGPNTRRVPIHLKGFPKQFAVGICTHLVQDKRVNVIFRRQKIVLYLRYNFVPRFV